MLETIINFNLESNNKNKNLANLLKVFQSKCILDYERLTSLLNSQLNESEKLLVFEAIIKSKIQYEKNRDRCKYSYNNVFKIYNRICDIKISPELFKSTLYSINSIELSKDDLLYDKKAIEIIRKLKSFGISNDTIIKFLNHVISKRNFPDLPKIINDISFETSCLFSDLFNIIKFNFAKLIDIFIAIFEDDQNNYLLETKVLYNLFLSNIKEEDTIIIINPSLLLIKKWINYSINNKTIFVVENFEQIKVLNLFIRSNNLIVGKEDLFNSIKTERHINVFHIFKKINNFSEDIILLDSLIRLQNFSETMFIAPDSTIYSNNEILDILNHLQICSATILPIIDSNSYKKRKCIIKCKKIINTTSYDSFKINKFDMVSNGRFPEINMKMFSTELSQKSFLEKRINLRSFYREEFSKLNKITNTKRQKSMTMSISNLLNINYIILNNSDKYRARCYFKDSNNKTIKDSILNSKCFSNIDDLTNWIENDYVFYNTKKNIRKALYNVYIDSVDFKTFDLKSFYLINYQLDNYIPNFKLNHLKTILNSDLGDICISSITCLQIEENINFIEENYGFSSSQSLCLLNSIFKYALDNEYCFDNPCNALKNKVKFSTISDITHSLSKKFLYPNEFVSIQHLYNKRKLTTMDIASLFRLFTGLEPNIICALNWKDINQVNINNETFYTMNIFKSYSNNKERIETFEKDYSIRKVPIPKVLYELLYTHIEKRNNNSTLEDSLILENTISPMDIYKSNRKDIKKILQFNDELLYIPDNNSNTVELNIAYYTNDIFKSNIYHLYAISNYFSIDEINYLLGYQATSVYYKNYCDLGNHFIQYKIYTKLNKIWEEFFNEIHISK